MYHDFDMASKERNYHHLIECDSEILLDMVQDNCKFSWVVPTLVLHIRCLAPLDWHVQLRHAWKEENRCANWIDNIVISFDSFNCISL